MAVANPFEEACAHYSEGKAMVREWLNLAEGNLTFSYFDAMREYDYILQGILLQVALADGILYGSEKLFIRNITEYADLLAGFKLVKGASEKELNWNDIDKLPDEEKSVCAQELMLALERYVEHFVTLLVALRNVQPDRDFLGEFKDNVFKIVSNLAIVYGGEIGGYPVKKEFAAGFTLFAEIIETKWQTLVG